MNEKIVGYIKSFSSTASLDTQKNIITRYCLAHDILCEKFYIDTTYRDRKVADVSRALQIGIPATCKVPMLPAWENLMVDIMDKKIDVILVDNFIRLYMNVSTKTALQRICQKYQVQIIEVGTDPFPNDTAATKVAIYHYTDQSQTRPIVVTNAIDSLYEYAAHSFPGSACGIFLDTSLLEYEHPNYDCLMENIDSFNVVLVHDIYRFSRKMGVLWSTVRRLYGSGIRIVSLNEGPVHFVQDTYLLQDKPLRVAIYDRDTSIYRTDTHELFMERCNLFIKYRTNWSITDIYLDKRNDPVQPNLQRLANDRATYDLILMDSFRKIHDDSNRFYKFKSKVKVPLVSLKEGSVL